MARSYAPIRWSAGCLPLAVLAVAIASCGALPNQSLEHSARGNLKRIHIVSPGFPERAEVRITNPIGAGFGVVGSLVESRRAATASTEMQRTLASAHYDFGVSLTQAIAAAVRKTGLQIARNSEVRPDRDRSRFLGRYPPLQPGDAYLDVFVSYVGFEAPQSSTMYRPRLELTARLVDARNGRTLFQNRIVYGMPENADEEVLLIRADERLGFRDRAALSADPVRTARALQSAIDTVAWELAKQLM